MCTCAYVHLGEHCECLCVCPPLLMCNRLYPCNEDLVRWYPEHHSDRGLVQASTRGIKLPLYDVDIRHKLQHKESCAACVGVLCVGRCGRWCWCARARVHVGVSCVGRHRRRCRGRCWCAGVLVERVGWRGSRCRRAGARHVCYLCLAVRRERHEHTSYDHCGWERTLVYHADQQSQAWRAGANLYVLCTCQSRRR